MKNRFAKYYLIFLVLMLGSTLFADEFIVKSFTELKNDLSARKYVQYDINGAPCALIKVRTDINNPISFDSNMGIPIAPELKVKGEYWVYVVEGERALKFMANDFIPKNYTLESAGIISSLKVYELCLSSEELNAVELPVLILTDPPDAEKWVNGEYLGREQTYVLPVGNYRLLIKKDGYYNFEKYISVNENSVLFDKIILNKIEPLPIEIISNPSNADIYINNTYRGKTNKGMYLFPGEYELKLFKADHITTSDTICIEKGLKNTFNYSLEWNYGLLNIKVEPRNATILIDNTEYIDHTDIKLQEGEHKIEIFSTGYNSKVYSIDIDKGDVLKKDFRLEKSTITVEVLVNPANATILIDKKDFTEKSELELSPGTHLIEILKEGYIAQNHLIEIDENMPDKFSYELLKNTAQLELRINPTDAQVTLNKEDIDVKEIIEVPEGRYLLEISKEGYESISKEINVKLNMSNKFDYSLKELTGGIQISISPVQSYCKLIKNGEEVISWTGMLRKDGIHVGDYELVIEAEGYKSQRKIITINNNAINYLNIELIDENTSSQYDDYTKYAKVIDSLGIELANIPAGRYLIGSYKNDQDENKVHDVYINGFLMAKTEITQQQFAKVFGSKKPIEKKELPKRDVTWDLATRFCNKLSILSGLDPVYTFTKNATFCDFNKNGFRLPTEAEWEYAACGGEYYRWSGTNFEKEIDDYIWCASNSDKSIQKVATKKPNGYGLFDMSGNVWEWCWDWYAPFYIKNININPIGPGFGHNKVMRGGSSYTNNSFCKVTKRHYAPTYEINDDLGFRICKNSPKIEDKIDKDHIVSDKNKNYDIGIKEKIIEGSYFIMGSKFRENEMPQHEVKVNDYYISHTEITQKQYNQVMNIHLGNWETPNYPINNISWYDAIAFCNKLSEYSGLDPVYEINGENITWDQSKNGYRLPTEAEWEFAAIDRNNLNVENLSLIVENANNYLWFDENSTYSSHRVAKKLPNANGLYDILGNVWEWCWDWYDAEYYSTCEVDNPTGPITGKYKVRRGGSYSSRLEECSETVRYANYPDNKNTNTGFRICRNKSTNKIKEYSLPLIQYKLYNFDLGEVKIPAVNFEMGTLDGREDTRPLHNVSLQGYYILKTEITNSIYKEVMQHKLSVFNNKNTPVDKITWYEAIEFCNKFSEYLGLEPVYTIHKDNVIWDRTKNGYRLPTEAEWEYAGKTNGYSQIYYETNSENLSWYIVNSGYVSHEVALKEPNKLGIYDMSGNVSEWCWDWYESDYYTNSDMNNPRGPLNGIYKVTRGGSWRDTRDVCDVTFRMCFSPENNKSGNYSTIGIRLCRNTEK